MSSALLPIVEQFLAETGIHPQRFGLLAAKNARLVERLRGGRAVLTTTDQKVRDYIANPTSRTQRASKTNSSDA